MTAILRYLSPCKNSNPVAETAAGQTVRDIESSLVSHERMELSVYLIFRNRIQRGSGLIQNNDRCIFVKCPGNSQLLLLASGRLHTVLLKNLKHPRIGSLRQLWHHTVQFYQPDQLIQPFRIRILKRNVLSKRKAKHLKILKYRRKLLHVFLIIILFYITPIQQYLSLGWVI